MWGIWCFDDKDWFREPKTSGCAVLAFETKQKACSRAAEEYGRMTYTEAKRDGWCEVRRLGK